jgi:dihydrofolate synthase / folylpolyglutamate synthase
LFSDSALALFEPYLNSLVNYEHTFPLGGSRGRPKLDPTFAACDRLALTLTLPNCVHIAGTKGKGSIVLLLEQLLAPDLSTLAFSSPHLVTVKERVRLNGRLLDDLCWNEGIAAIRHELQHDPAIKLTYFETAWVFYLWTARKFQPQVHIVETGLGGSWDATNVLAKSVAALTLVDYDHTEILGSTLTAIATDKSGIVKPDSTVFVGRQTAEAAAVYERVCRDRHARARWFGRDFTVQSAHASMFDYEDEFGVIANIELPSAAPHLRENAALAIRIARELHPALDINAVRTRLRTVSLPGRQQLLPGMPPVLLDVAHNPVSFAALAETLRRDHPGKPVAAVIGMMKDKDARASLAHLQGLVAELRTVHLGNPRSLPPEQLADIAISLGISAAPVPREAAFEWLHSAPNVLGLVAGSFYLAGDYLQWRDRARIA